MTTIHIEFQIAIIKPKLILVIIQQVLIHFQNPHVVGFHVKKLRILPMLLSRMLFEIIQLQTKKKDTHTFVTLHVTFVDITCQTMMP